MSRRNVVQTSARWALAFIAALLLLTLGALLDGPDGTTEAQAVADDAAAAWMDSRNLAKRNAIAQALCDSELGPGTQVIWTREGDLVCWPASQLVAKGGAL